VSFVDYRVGLAGGRVRRLLARVLVVLGGAFGVTAVGWLLCAGSADADSLPAVPVVPSVVSAIAPQLSTSDITLPALPLVGITDRVHDAASGVGTKVRGKVRRVEKTTKVVKVRHKVVPVAVPVAHHDPIAPVARAARAARAASAARVGKVVRVGKPSTVAPAVLVQHRHAAVRPPGVPRSTPAPTPQDTGRQAPLLPPAGPSDSSAHGAGNVAGGSGGAHLPLTHVLGHGPHLAGIPSTPRLAVAPGQQPGTSPD
jgi:hypothetical protein